jgi:hypothetical protein
MNNPLISAFAPPPRGRSHPEILDRFDPETDRIAVYVGKEIVGEIVPEHPGQHEMGYAYNYRGATRGRDGVTPIGPAFDPAGMKRRIISVMFNGDAAAFAKATLKKIRK